MREITFLEAIREALRQEMKLDENVFILGEDVGAFGGCFGVTAGLFDEFGPDRVMDTPISESAIMGASLGSALMGLRPVPEIMFIDFTPQCFDYLTNQAPKVRYMCGGQVEKLPLVIRTTSGGWIRAAGQHSQSLEGWFTQVPGLKVVMPSTAHDAKGLLTASLRDNNPVLYIEHKVLYGSSGPVPEEEYLIPLGQAEVKKEGTDVTLISYSLMLQKTLAAAEQLAGDGVSAEVVDLRTLSPLDHDTLAQSVQKTHRAVVIQEAYESAGMASQVIKSLMDSSFDYIDAPIKTVAAPDTVIPFSPILEDHMLPNEDKIIQAAREIMG
ncbi:MAG: alpha-ketoacid dehydrogenase subunit beta [Deltaproteobacteria bacterium]|nr:alpha-ketoacid dehydrogenase subunit beta [Deltaproteobacteria bacterium]MBL7216346.1 alpha-ketoacid dehydrogenase subunit beta [Desulfobacteraceae bacterium]